MDPLTLSPGRAGLSERLLAFVGEAPWERESILAFVLYAARRTPPGAHVLDVGAGDAPYRELFGHADYRTTDWEASPHEGGRLADVIASADDLPLEDGSFDVVLSTQVLEHVSDPGAVLAEMRRVLRPGGALYLTAPLVWELHELPHDFFRYTAPGLEALLARAGFVEIDVAARNDCFTTIAQLMRNVDHMMGRTDDGQNARREQAAAALRDLADEVAALAPLDARQVLPLGYAAIAKAAA